MEGAPTSFKNVAARDWELEDAAPATICLMSETERVEGLVRMSFVNAMRIC